MGRGVPATTSPSTRSMGRGLLLRQLASDNNNRASASSSVEIKSDGDTETDTEMDTEDDGSDSSCASHDTDCSSSESSDDDMASAEQPNFVSPSGEIWSQDPPPHQGRASSSNVLRSSQGVTSYATQRIDTDVASAFKLIFDQDMMNTILFETNREGQRVKRSEWKSITKCELDAYFGLCILRGVYKSKSESIRELWHPERGRKIFSSTMALRRFEEIRRFLRFDNRETRNARLQRDKLAAVRLMIDGVVQNSQKCYTHGACVTVDEQLYAFRGKCFYIQYMPSKPAKYGLKFWLLCDADTYYCSNIILYTGKDESRKDVSLGEHVVMSLCTHLYGSGRNITCDNFFTSISLARSLAKKSLTLVGTMRSTLREVPLALRPIKDRELHSSEFCYSTDGIQLVSYKAKKNKNVLVLSSQHRQPSVSQDPPNKPEVIYYYNSTKGGVDALDERVGTYSVRYKTRRWHVRVFCDLLDIAAFNAFVLYSDVFPNYNAELSHRRRLFLTDLGMSLSKQYREEKNALLVSPLTSSFSTLRARCELCPRLVDRKTQMKCATCEKFICREHSRCTCLNC
jgi:hypothetical protein